MTQENAKEKTLDTGNHHVMKVRNQVCVLCVCVCDEGE